MDGGVGWWSGWLRGWWSGWLSGWWSGVVEWGGGVVWLSGWWSGMVERMVEWDG